MKMKNIDILNFNFRNDFQQVLCLYDEKNFFQDVTKTNFLELGKKLFNQNNEIVQINNLLKETSDKIDTMFKLGIEIFDKSEYVQNLVYSQLFRAL